jgi:glycosyltransferase involved in cell wall biosynthesis
VDWAAVGFSLVTGRIVSAFRTISAFHRNRDLGARTYRFLRARQRTQPVSVIVHTKRDARLLRDVFRIQNVNHHPLSFIATADAEKIRKTATLDQFPLLRTFPPGAKLIGSFGFLSPYKGFETALRALHYLPEDYHLLIFGGVHPQAIKREQVIDPYIQTLLDEAHIGQSILDTMNVKGTPLSLNLDAASKDLLSRHPDDLYRRVHFLGVHNDEAFMRAMVLCDMVVLPYLEVGQSSSGPIAMALEMGCRVLASRTLAFLQFARYHPNQIEFFDIGNYAELADLILADTPASGGERQLDFHTGTNTTMYLEASQPRFSKLSRQRDKISQPSNAISESVL